jgi:hypothetical protein
MTNTPRKSELEDKMKKIYSGSTASPAFVKALDAKLSRKAETLAKRKQRPFYLRPAWISAAAVLAILLITFFAIGPEKVYAEMRRLLGYIPGVGLVDSSAPIRVLKEPVEQTRDGVTITVTSAVLTADRSHIEYRIFGVQRSAYPTSEDVPGCMQPEFLMLPDGTKLERTSDYPAIPADVNEVTLVIPCIGNTLPGKAPESWILPLSFVPAPPGLTVLPVQEITATATLPAAAGTATSEPVDNAMSVTKVIETADGYILVGKFAPVVKQGDWVQTTNMGVIVDANGKNVPYSIPNDIDFPGQNIGGGGFDWAYQFNASGVRYPITLRLDGVTLLNPDPEATASLEFDTGTNPQPGQTWQVNQQVELAGHVLTLKTVSADGRQGYSFNFTVDPSVYGVGVAIDGYSSVGGGGGGNQIGGGSYSTSLAYTSLPAGKLKVILSHLTTVSGPLTWTTAWSPTTPRTDIPAVTTLPQGVCANAGTIASYGPLPTTITGQAILFEQLGETWGLALYNLDGSGKTVIAQEANWGDLSRDGTKVVYAASGGFQVYDIDSAESYTLAGNDGYNPRWSAGGTQIAYVGGAAEGVSIVDIQTLKTRQVSSEGFETVIGWAPDDALLYIAVPAAGGAAWQVRAVNPQTGAYEVKFLIEDGSVKALNAALSADGKWIAYRGRDNNSVYLAKTDGSETHLLLDAPAAATSGLAWTSSGWLAVSLMQNDTDVQKVVLVDPATCAGYVVPSLKGYLYGVHVN